MRPGLPCQHPAARRALDQALLQQVGLDHLLDGIAAFRQRRRQRFNPHRPATVVFGDQRQIAPVGAIQPQLIDPKPRQRPIGDLASQAAIAFDQREIDHPAQKPARDARRPPRPGRDFPLEAERQAWTALYAGHIEAEDGRAYPQARAGIDAQPAAAETLAAIGAEMAARRRVPGGAA